MAATPTPTPTPPNPKQKQNKSDPASTPLLVGLDVDTGKYYARDGKIPKFIQALFKTGPKYLPREVYPPGYNMPGVWPMETDIDDRGRPIKVVGNKEYDGFREHGQVKFFPGEVNVLPAFSFKHFKRAVDSNRFAQPGDEDESITLADGGWREIELAADTEYKIIPSRPLPEPAPGAGESTPAQSTNLNMVSAEPVVPAQNVATNTPAQTQPKTFPTS